MNICRYCNELTLTDKPYHKFCRDTATVKGIKENK